MSDILCFDIVGDSMFPTYKDGDSIYLKKITKQDNIEVSDIVVFPHPFKKDCNVIKRVVKIKNKSKLFVEGDNADINSTDDSHNFGYIDIDKLIAIKKSI